MACFTAAEALSDEERYFFDLQGFLVVEAAVDPAHVQACNAILDDLRDLRPGRWRGWVHGHDYGGREGLNLQQIVEAGEPFERLIDHPAWIAKVHELVGGGDGFDALHGPLFIDECFASIRGPGEAIGLHSGGHRWCKRTQYLVRDGAFHCGQVNVLLALGDIGPGDGATMVVPGSHKAAFPHPDLERQRMRAGALSSADGVRGAREVHLRAGDALVFVDALMHGSAERCNAGERRLLIQRYGPSWGRSRHGYQPSPALLARLTPQRRAIIHPQQALLPPSTERNPS